VNDIGTADPSPSVQQSVGDALIAAYHQFATRAHAAGLPIFISTITPFSEPNFANDTQPYSNPERERTRQRINTFIRTSGVFDAVVDFDDVVRDETNPAMLAPMFNSGDFLHPSVEGYQAMADAFPVEVFEKFGSGVSKWM
jgi:lysophospholipase L1-like esterase